MQGSGIIPLSTALRLLPLNPRLILKRMLIVLIPLLLLDLVLIDVDMLRQEVELFVLLVRFTEEVLRFLLLSRLLCWK